MPGENISTNTATQTAEKLLSEFPGCFSCGPVNLFITKMQEYSSNFASELNEPMLLIFNSLSILWVVWVGISILLYNKTFKDFRRPLFHIIIASVLLTSQGTPLLEEVFNMSLELMGELSMTAFKVAGGAADEIKYEGFVGLVAAAEKTFFAVFGIAADIMSTLSWTVLLNLGYGLALLVPFTLLLFGYISQVIVAVFRLVLLTIFGPFFFLCFAFEIGHEMAKTGIKTLIAAVLTIFSATASIATAIFLVKALEITPQNAGDLASITNPAFIAAILFGWAGTAMLAEGTSIANSIAGSSLTNTAAGIMTAGLTGTAGMVAGGTLAKTNPLKWKQTKAGFVSGASNAKEMAKDMGAVALGAGSAAVGGARLSKYAAYKIANAPKAGYNAYRGRKFNKGLSNMMSSNSETFEA